jgi:predicted MPP superfamily phosphohydrolase
MSFRVLHLSDIHLSTAKVADFGFVRAALLNDLQTYRTNGFNPHIFVFSGDLVQAGETEDDFELARKEFIQPVLDAVGLGADHFFIVPGNHDINRKEVRENEVVEIGQRDSLRDREKLNAFVDRHLSESSFGDFNFKRLAPYYTFARRIMRAISIRSNVFFCTYKLEHEGRDIGIVCFNNAWRCTGEPDDKDYGVLLLGERVVTEAVKDIAECTIKIATYHHPVSWLRGFDREDCRPHLLKNFDLILTGHTHHASPEQQATPSGRTVFSEGGALYVSRRYFDGYCFIELDGGAARFVLRRYEDDNARHVFEPATNVAANGEYIVRLGRPEDVAEFSSLESVLRKIRPFLEERARDHMLATYSEVGAPRNLDDLYVALPIRRRSQFESTDPEPKEAEISITEEQILKSDNPIVISGPSESGKTTLAWRLCLSISRRDSGKLQIPVYIDLTLVKVGTGYLEREIRNVLAQAGIVVNIVEQLKNGNFFVVLDNFGRALGDKKSEARKRTMIEAFLSAYPKNQYVLFMDESRTPSGRQPTKGAIETKYQAYFIHSLGRTGMRELTKRWLEPSGLYNRGTVEAVVRRIERSNLPRTAHIVSMVLWSLERERSLGPVNEATLLERFVEAILNKANVGEAERGALDYKIKETFLSHLAYDLTIKQSGYIGKNDLLRFTIDFFKARSWSNDSSQFIEGLLGVGILAQSASDDEGPRVSFRYACLRQYFTARYLSRNGEALQSVLESDLVLEFSREVDIMTGLSRDDANIIERIVARAKRLAHECDLYETLSKGQDIRFRLSKPEETADQLVGEIQEMSLTDTELDQLMDEMEASRPRLGTDGTAEKSKPASDEVERADERLYDLLLTTTLLSSVVRNSELVDNEDLKSDAVKTALEGWCYFAIRSARMADDVLDGKAPTEIMEKFSALSEREKKFFEIFAKYFMHVIVGVGVYDTMGTQMLKSILQKCMGAVSPERVLERMLYLYVLIDLAFVDSTARQVEAIELLDEFVKDYRDKPAILALLLMKLHALYFRPNLGTDNRNSIEELMADINLKMSGKRLSPDLVGTGRSLFRKKLQKIRMKTGTFAESGESGTKELG